MDHLHQNGSASESLDSHGRGNCEGLRFDGSPLLTIRQKNSNLENVNSCIDETIKVHLRQKRGLKMRKDKKDRPQDIE